MRSTYWTPFLLWSCAARVAPEPVIEAPAVKRSDVLPAEGSICESERGTPVELIDLPMYQVYTIEQHQQVFTPGTQFQVDLSPMAPPTPRAATQESWTVTRSDSTGVTFEIRPEEGGEPSTGPSSPQVWEVNWEVWANRFSFPVESIEVTEAACTLGSEAISGIQITHQYPLEGAERKDVYCFAQDRVMPAISLDTYDDESLSGSDRLLSFQQPE